MSEGTYPMTIRAYTTKSGYELEGDTAFVKWLNGRGVKAHTATNAAKGIVVATDVIDCQTLLALLRKYYEQPSRYILRVFSENSSTKYADYPL